MDAIIAALVGWIAANSSLMPSEPPRISFLSSQQMQARLSVSDKGGALQLKGFFDPPSKTIYLRDTWRPNNLADNSVLLHELVHHAQWANEVIAFCLGSLERQAYDLQFTWLREQGVDNPYELIGTSVLVVLFAGTCPE